MIKTRLSFGRLAVLIGFALSCFGLLLFLWLSFGGSVPLKAKGYRLNVRFSEATQLAEQADVRISGVPVGHVVSLKPRGGLTRATLELDPRYAPLPADARAILRQKTLLGETYVELTPGRRGGPTIPDGGQLAQSRVATSVQLDEILRTFDPRTRRDFQTWMISQARGVDGRGRDLNDALGQLAPFSEDTAELLGVLDRQKAALRRTVSATGTVLDALTTRRGQLRGLITSADSVFSTTAARNRDLAALVRVLPTFERESRATLARLDGFAARTDPLVTQLRPAARELSPTLRDVQALSPDLRALLRELNPLIDASRRGFPALQRTLNGLRPVLGQLDPFLRQANPLLDYLGLYRSEITALLGNVAAATQAGDGTTKYLRTTNPLTIESLATYSRRVGTNRANAYAQPRLFSRLAAARVPGYETRQCGRPLPSLDEEPPTPLPVPAGQTDNLQNFRIDPDTGKLGSTLLAAVRELAIERAKAPPCLKQGAFNIGGSATQYPQVRARPAGQLGP